MHLPVHKVPVRRVLRGRSIRTLARVFSRPGIFEHYNRAVHCCLQSKLSLISMRFSLLTLKQANGFQYAGLEYYGECYCDTSITANLAPASDCNYTCNGDQKETCGGFSRLSVYHDPTFKASIATAKDYSTLGCWTEGNGGRALAWNQGQYLDKSKMTTEYCLDGCGSKGYPYAGTEYGQECFCGVQLDLNPTR